MRKELPVHDAPAKGKETQPKAMRSTIRQVAERAGVSAVTVSNVLRGVESRASEETRQRVLEAVHHLNYLPVRPPTVQNRRVETGIISLVFEHADVTHHEIDLRTYEGLVEGARRHNYDLLTVLRNGRSWTPGREELRFLDQRSDGFIFAVPARGEWENAMAALGRHSIPTVSCYRRDTPEGVAWVDVDNEGVIGCAVEHLVSKGHRRIGYLSGPPHHFTTEDRRAAWIKSMKQHGLGEYTRRVVQGADENWEPDAAAMEQLLDMDLTAVVCFNDSLALDLWDVARGLTTISHSFIDIGRLAMEAWMELRKAGFYRDCCKVTPFTLIEGHSVSSSADIAVQHPHK
jgi:DNA-binding LacI/PurR family transcriptional regulator